MARRLNWLGKLVVVAVVIVIVMGGYFGGKLIYENMPTGMLTGFSVAGIGGGGSNSPEALIAKFSGAMTNKTYSEIFGLLSGAVPKSVTETEFAAKLAAKYDNMPLTLKEISTKGKEGYAVFTSGSEYVTVPIVKENGTWKINYFATEARCNDACTAARCQDDKVLIECMDINSDGCAEEVAKTCDVVCENNACLSVRQNYVLKLGDVTATEPKVQLFVIDSDGSVTLEVGYDIYIFKQGESKTVKGLTITVNSIGKDSVSIKVVPAK